MQEVPEPLPRCDNYGVHLQATRFFKRRQSDKCNKSTKRRIRQRDVEMADSCGEMEFNLDREEGDEIVENVPTFQYMGRPLDQTDDYWPSMQRNIIRASSVWGRLGTLL